tara:strand:+ start:920 stop:1549 length:630 start_codon:yes stop_codon:yes gene_type:complete
VLNNIEKIQTYFNNEKEQNFLIISKISEEVGSFYDYLIRYFSSIYKVGLRYNENFSNNLLNNDLFGEKTINVIDTTSSKKIDDLLISKGNLIVYTNYKNFKKYQNTNYSINSYNYILDIKIFLRQQLKIDDNDLLDICIKTPQLIYSEISKFLINQNTYQKDTGISSDTNNILNIRKDITELKRLNKIQDLFIKIIEEAKYKRFSFLTY